MGKRKCLVVSTVIGIMVAVASCVLVWFLTIHLKHTNFNAVIMGMFGIAMFFATFLASIASVFSFVNDYHQKKGTKAEGFAFADFFSAEKTPRLAGFATGFAASMLGILFILGF